MFFVDIPKLLGRITEEGFNMTTFSAEIGVNRNTLRTYIKDYTKIPYDVLGRMADALHCNFDDANSIFFATKLS